MFTTAKSRAGSTERWSRISFGRSRTIKFALPIQLSKRANGIPVSCLRRSRKGALGTRRQQNVLPSCFPCRLYATSYASNAHHSGGDAVVDDWSTIEVEILQAEIMPPLTKSAAATSSFAETAFTVPTTTTSTTEGGSKIGGFPTSSPICTAAVETIDSVDTYAKAKVMNFIRRQQQQQRSKTQQTCTSASFTGSSGDAGPSTSNATIPGMEVREVQGTGDGGVEGEGSGTQFHARWRLPLPAEYGERFGEGFAPTAKEAENVAAMHAERVIDALGFPLFLLSSKQRKHAEAARAAGRWAPMPPPVTSSFSADSPGSASVAGTANATAAEIVPPPETPSPPPLRLHRISARERQERQLRIDNIDFTPVEKNVFAPLTCTLASPYYYDPTSVRRIESFFRAHRTSFARCLRFFLLKGSQSGSTAGAAAAQQQQRQRQSNVFLAQLTLPLPPRFGIRVAMGRGPTKRDAATLACMHAELIIDAVGFALYPTNHIQQAIHAEECARVRRWCAPPGDCEYRYTVASPAPLELVEKLDSAARAAATRFVAVATSPAGSGGSLMGRQHDRGESNTRQENALGYGHRDRTNTPRSDLADIQIGTSSSSSVESILVQHHHAIAAMSHFANEVSMRDYENACLLLERYLEPFVVAIASAASDATAVVSSSSSSALRSLMFVEMLGQRDRPTYRATITVPLVDDHGNMTAAEGSSQPTAGASAVAPLPYTHSFVAIGIADTPHIAELAASLHALRVLAALNRLTLLHGNPIIQQALESFALRGQLPMHKPTAPMLYPADVPAETPLPAAVRVMEGVVGRIATTGLQSKTKEARAQVFTPGVKVLTKKAERRASEAQAETHTRVLQRYFREDFLLQELKQARLRLKRLDWDTTADAHHRIVVAPDTNPKTARQYVHTLSSVRNPDSGAALRIRDYLERHGKTLDMVCTTTRVPVASDAPEEGYMYVTTLELPMPESFRRRTAEDDAAAAITETDEVRRTHTASSTTTITTTHAGTTMVTCTAQGEAPTREESLLMCNAHAELLLDALGIPLYDHPLLQCKHADAARALGRWAPLARGGLLAPPALRPIPPPLRKVSEGSALWALVQRERHAAAMAAVVSRSNTDGRGNSAAAAAAVSPEAAGAGTGASAALGGVDASAGDANDEVLCDVSRMRYVHNSDIFHFATKIALRYYSEKGLDFFRAIRQYKVTDPKYGVVHRAIAELPIPAMYGKRYAVGLADTKRHACHLCAMHVVHILDALNISVHRNRRAQLRYAHTGAVKGRKVALPSHGLAGPNTPTPPGLYSLFLSEAANERPPTVPVCPSSAEAKEDLVWSTYVKKCETYRQWWNTYVTHKAVAALPLPTAPRSGVPVEDAMLALAEATPLDLYAQRHLRDLCGLAGLTQPPGERITAESIKVSVGKRVYLAISPLYGTPYSMRGFSSEGAAECRLRTCMHGVELIRHVVHANSSGVGRSRGGWTEGTDRTVCMLDPLKGDITHHGRVWVLRLWSSMHFPPRALQLTVRGDESGSLEGATTEPNDIAAVASAAAAEGGAKPVRHTAHECETAKTALPKSAKVDEPENQTEGPGELEYHASLAVVELGASEKLKVVVREANVAPGPHGTAAVQGAVQRVFFHLQRTPTMQALRRFLSRQPQVHLPSLRTLQDRDGAVEYLFQLLLSAPSNGAVADAAKKRSACKDGRLSSPNLSLLLPCASELLVTAPVHCTWPVQVLQRWVRAYTQAGDASLADLKLPYTLAPLFTTYGLVKVAGTSPSSPSLSPPPSQRDVPTGTQHNEVEAAPSRMAQVLALLCQCLPPFASSLPHPTIPSSSPTHWRGVSASASDAVVQDRTLPLQLAHLLLMGLLLDCSVWTVWLVAMVACAEDTLLWNAQARRALRHLPLRPSALLSAEAHTQESMTNAEDALWSFVSVDVVEAALLSAGAGELPPLPSSVKLYARQLSWRLSKLFADVLRRVHVSAVSHGFSDAAWLTKTMETLWSNGKGEEDEDALALLPRLSPQETRKIRALLQCAVVASAAPHEVWVRALRAEDAVRDAYMSDEGDDDDAAPQADAVEESDPHNAVPTSGEVFVFQGRRTAAFAALCVDGTDLTRTDTDSVHTLSSMATCFASFGCAVKPVDPSADTENFDSRSSSASVFTSMSAMATQNKNKDDDDRVGEQDKGDEEESDAVEGNEGDDFETRSIGHTHFTRVLGTCVSPLAAMIVGQRSLRSSASPKASQGSLDAPSGVSALRLAEEDLPMLMTAFQDTVPLVVHDSKSASALQQIAFHLRSRIEELQPFTEVERNVLCQLLILPVEAIRDDRVDDA